MTVKKKKKKSGNSLPLSFNDFNRWNKSSWHHLWVPKLMGSSIMSSAHSTSHCNSLWGLDMRNQYFISYQFQAGWAFLFFCFLSAGGTSVRLITKSEETRVFCLLNTSHDPYIWSRQFLSTTWERAGNEEGSKVEASATTVTSLRCSERKNATALFYKGGIMLINRRLSATNSLRAKT